jgi:ComF family protein
LCDYLSVLARVVAHCLHCFDVIVPLRCAVCATHGNTICSDCIVSLSAGPLLYRPPRGDTPSIVALGPYEGALRSTVLNIKFRHRPLAAMCLGAILGAKIRVNVEAIVPVPLHEQRLRSRGFNQAHALAQGVARALSLPVSPKALIRIVPTQAQSSLPLAGRQGNVRDAFSSGPESKKLRGMNVLLVDDVVTTGETLAACARVLRQSGAQCFMATTLAIKS